MGRNNANTMTIDVGFTFCRSKEWRKSAECDLLENPCAWEDWEDASEKVKATSRDHSARNIVTKVPYLTTVLVESYSCWRFQGPINIENEMQVISSAT